MHACTCTWTWWSDQSSALRSGQDKVSVPKPLTKLSFSSETLLYSLLHAFKGHKGQTIRYTGHGSRDNARVKLSGDRVEFSCIINKQPNCERHEESGGHLTATAPKRPETFV